jgi:hypothetical protein
MSTESFRVGKDTLGNGYEVSTVELYTQENGGVGIMMFDNMMGISGGKFETIVFNENTGGEDHELVRYNTREDAEQGHAVMVEKWKDKPPLEVDGETT